MTRPVKTQPDRLGAALAHIFRTEGYAGASLRSLGAATGLKSASLYHRFRKGKAEMAEMALRHVAGDFQEQVIAPLQGSGAAYSRLAESAKGLRRFYADGDLACLLAVFSLSDAPAAVRLPVSEAVKTWIDSLEEALNDAGVVNARARAEDLVAGVQGALILAQAGQGRTAFERAAARLAAAGQ